MNGTVSRDALVLGEMRENLALWEENTGTSETRMRAIEDRCIEADLKARGAIPR